jgi:hypothetical protein
MFKHLILASVFDKIDEIIEKVEENTLSLWGDIFEEGHRSQPLTRDKQKK